MPQGFPYKDLTQLYKAVEGEAFQLPRLGKVEALKKPVHGEGFEMKNALVVQPMEGCDADENGAPTDWTIRRYRRFAAGGAALVWMEAVSVCPEGRANPHQLMITEYRGLSGAHRRDQTGRASGWGPAAPGGGPAHPVGPVEPPIRRTRAHARLAERGIGQASEFARRLSHCER